VKRRACFLLLGFCAAAQLEGQCPDGTPPPCAPRLARAATLSPTSVAVLPFANRSPDTADVYLAEGMTEEIGNRLTQLGRLQVISRGMVAAQWRRSPDGLAAARALRVAWFVNGSVRHVSGQLLVNVELVRAITGEEVWASRFPRSDRDMFAVQAEIAESVAAVVGGRLSPGERAAVTRRPTGNNEAYRLYLNANVLIRRRTEADTRSALVSLAEAVRLDPNFAAAWGRIGFARAQQASFGFERGTRRDSLYDLSAHAAARALQLDSSAADAWIAVGYVAIRRGDFAGAHSALDRALRLDSLYAETLAKQGLLYGPFIGLDDRDLATAWFRRAAVLDPTDRNIWRNLSAIAAEGLQLRAAEALADTALTFGRWSLALVQRASVRFCLGNGTGALADLEEAERLGGVPLPRPRALVTLLLGDSAPARAVVARLRAQADSGQVLQEDLGSGSVTTAGELARFNMALGQRSEALAAIERLRATPDSLEPRCSAAATCSVSLSTWRLLHDPIFAPLRAEPRWVRLLEETRPRVTWLEGPGL
jgi:TolB-like protein/tetratricopeptide (TPR) repeat protein